MDTIFGKIARGEVPVEKIYEDDICLAFPDVSPQAPIHILVIPREPFVDAASTPAQVLGHVMEVAARIGREKCPEGFRLVTNPWSNTTSWSTHSAPAPRSFLSDGHEVIRRPRTASASINVHGTWQFAAIGCFPTSTNWLTKRTARGSVRSTSGLATPPGKTRAV